MYFGCYTQYTDIIGLLNERIAPCNKPCNLTNYTEHTLSREAAGGQ